LIFFDNRICEDVADQRIDILMSLVARNSGRQRDVEELALPHFGDAVISQASQRGSDGLTLRVEDRSF